MRVEQQIEYEAQNDAEAFSIARERLGSEAVILSSRPVKLGGFMGFFRRDALWVTAGILVPDKDDAKKESHDRMMAFQHLLEVRRDVRRAVSGEDRAEAAHQRDVQAAISAFAPNPAVTPGKAAASAYGANAKPQQEAPSSSPEQDEIKEIKDTLSKVLQRLDGADATAAAQAQEEQPEQAQEEIEPMSAVPRAIDDVARRLLDAEVDFEIATALSDEYRERGRSKILEEWLSGVIPVMGVDTTTALGGRKVLFAGSTGVGKTTTIAKIASAQSLWDNKKVVLMTADTYRIAAVEQLRTYAKILSIPIEIVPEPKDIQAAMKKHGDADLILLDTAGRSHYDGSRIEELNALYDAFEPDSVHLVLSSNVKYRDMQDIVERMGVVPLTSLLFTKLDETSSYGIMLNIVRDFGLPMSFFTTGQNVPNDIEVARGERFVRLLLGIDNIRKD